MMMTAGKLAALNKRVFDGEELVAQLKGLHDYLKAKTVQGYKHKS